MIKNFTKKVLCIGLFIQCSSIQGMFTLRNSRQLTNQYKRAGYNQVPQRRYQWQPIQQAQKETQLKQNSLILKDTGYPYKNFWARGAAVASSRWLPNVLSYNIEQHKLDASDSMAKFSMALFQLSPDGHISIGPDKDMSYVLSPEFWGVLRGAREKNLLEKPSVVKEIVALGQVEYIKMMGNNKEVPKDLQDKIRDFIVVMNKANENDSNMAQSLEDAYLFLRIDPGHSHDMMHYLLGFNRYYPDILSEQRSQEFKDILARNDQSVRLSGLDYNQNERKKFIDELLQTKMPSDRVKLALKDFPLAMDTMLREKRNRDLYSQKVKMTNGSYENHIFVMCAEGCFRDLFNNMFLDEELQIFNPLKFFPTLTIDDNVLDFYNRYKNVNTINGNEEVGNDFLKLVSGVDGVTYVNKENKYEISSIANKQNLIALCNKFFSIQAKTLGDLGKMLSNKRRELTFKLVHGRDGDQKIAITIHDKETDKTKYMYLHFVLGHTNFEVGEENKDKIFLDPKILLEEHNSPETKAFLLVNPKLPISLLFKIMQTRGDVFDTSLFHAFPRDNDGEKSQLIRAIVLYSKDPEALNFAYSLYDSLSSHHKKLLEDVVSKSKFFKEKLNESSLSSNDKQMLKE
jgi:hypothetical protein